jgi:manganese/iron transport system ATP-binding protein
MSASGIPTVSIALDHVSVAYPNGNKAISDTSIALSGGTNCALVGINGSGKSTLFKTLMGFLKPSGGSVLINGQSVRSALKSGAVAYVPQSEDVDWSFPVLVRDVVMMGRYGHMGLMRRPKANDHAAVSEALARVDMTAFAMRQIGELSGGQKKRVFLARALAQKAKIILLDEPFTGVDVKTEAAIIDLLAAMRDEGCLILVSTHNLGSVPDFCDQAILFNRTVIAAGRTSDVFTPDNLERAFGGVLRRFRLGGDHLHDDDDPRAVTVLTDDERPLVYYGKGKEVALKDRPADEPATQPLPKL